MKIVNVDLRVRYHKTTKRLVITNNKYNIHIRMYSYKRKKECKVVCKVKDRETNTILFSKLYHFNEQLDMEQIKHCFLYSSIPKEFKEIEKFIFTSSL